MSDNWGRSVITGSPLNLALIYLLLGGLWIAFSDLAAITLIENTTTLSLVQTVKGWAFVLGSAILVYGLAYVGQRRLEATNSELDRALRQTSIFHRLIRHNLRNQCNIILGHTTLLEDQIDDDVSNSLAIIEAEADRLADMSHKAGLIADVVDDTDDPTAVQVADVVESSITTMTTHEAVNREALSIEIDEAVTALADPRLEVAINELLDNAIRHGNLEAGPLSVMVDETNGEVQIVISDAGPGIPAIEREAIMEDLETPLTHSEGLGLWLAKIIVAESAGEFDIRENDRGGTTAEICLPTPAASITETPIRTAASAMPWIVP